MSNCRKFNFLKKYKKFIFSLLFLFLGFGIFADEVTTIVINNARRTEYKKAEDTGNESIFLDGNVELSVQKADTTSLIRADRVVYDRETEMLYAEGSVQIVQKKSSGEDTTTANSILLNTKTMEGIFDGARVVMGNTDAFSLPSDSVLVIFADVFGKTDTNVISFKNSKLTFCDEENPHWQIKASRTWLLPGGEFAFLNALLFVGPIPVLYFPAFYYPKDELVFNPVFSYKPRTGYSIQNTLYLYGRKPLPTSTTSSSSDSSAAQAVESLKSFLRPNVLKEQKLEGLMLRNLDENYSGNTSDYVKLLVDWYSNLGFMVGVDTNFLPSDFFISKIRVGANLGFSNTIFKNDTYYDIFSPISGKQYTDNSNFLGLKLPFRYSANIEVEIQEPFRLTLTLPIYSDPFFGHDFINYRSEHMDWISFFMENALGNSEETETISETSSFTWNLNTSFTPKLPDFIKPYINSMSISTTSFVNILSLNTTFNTNPSTSPSSNSSFDSFFEEDNVEEVDDNWKTYTPERKFFYPSQITPVNLKFSMNGTLFQYPKSKTITNTNQNFSITMNKPDEIKSQSQLQKEQEEKELLEKEESGEEESDEESEELEENEEQEDKNFYIMTLPELTFSNSSQKTLSGINYSLGYSLNTTLNTQLAYSSVNLNSPDDFKWENVRSYMYSFTSPLSLNSSFKFGSDLFSLTNSVTYTPSIQDHPFVLEGDKNGGYSESSIKSLRQADFNARKQDIVNSNSVGVYPFRFLPIFNETGITWNTNFKLLRIKFLGDLDNPEWEIPKFDFEDPESVTTNNVNLILAASEKEGLFKQSLTFSVVMPPQLKQYSATLNLKFPFVSFSLGSGFSQKEKDSPEFKKNPLQQSLSLSLFNSTLTFSESFNYNLEDNNPDSFKLSASWKGITASYIMSYTYGADFDESVGWISRKEKEFLPYSASLSIAPKLPTFNTWFNRVTFTPSINANVVVDLIKPTSSYLLFTPSISFKINEFLTFTFSSTSRNSVLYRYFQTAMGYPGRIPGEQNFFVDLANSFRFDNEQLRKGSGFKLKSLNFEITHDLHDWDLKMVFKMEPRLVTKNGVSQYDFSPYITIGVVWRPIEAIKTQIVDDYGTWKLE